MASCESGILLAYTARTENLAAYLGGQFRFVGPFVERTVAERFRSTKLKYTIIGNLLLLLGTLVGLGWYVNAFLRLECPFGAAANLSCYGWGLLQLIVPIASGTLPMRLLLPLLSAFGVEFVVRVWVIFYYKPWRTNPKFAAENALPSGGDSEWTKHVSPMDRISLWYWMGVYNVFVANFLNTLAHARVGAIGIFESIVILILCFIMMRITIVFLQLCRATNAANRLLVHQKLIMALHYTKRLFRTRFGNKPDRQIQLEA